MGERKSRSVKRLLYAEQVDMGGFPVRQPLPTKNLDQIDPFLLLHHAEVKYSKTRDPRTSGVGPHPHRGFSPVTFVFKGAVHHRDSRGNNSVVHAGGTQWMNAGLGIIHSERPPIDLGKSGSAQEIIQLWINTPRKHKMDEPMYFPLTADATPSYKTSDENVEIKVVAGKYGEAQSPIPTLVNILALRMTFKKGGSHFFEIPENFNSYIYALDGRLNLKGFGVMEGLNMAYLNNDGTGIEVEALESTRFILMAGEPLNEPVEKHGPFVMSNSTEIMEAIRDYQMGKMGVLIEEWESDDH